MIDPTSPDVTAIAAAGGIAVQPIGATEQHGPHLPLTTDALIATALAEAAADAVHARAASGDEDAPSLWMLPTLAYGLSPEHAGFPGTVTLSSTTLLAVCLDIARSVAAAGIRTLVFVNAHGGNPELLQVVARDIRDQTGVLAVSVHGPSLPLPAALADQMGRADLDVHAGFYETSVLLALHPAAVRLPLAAADGIDRIDALATGAVSPSVGLFGAVPLPWRTRDVSASGTIGDPTGASAEWGREALHAQGLALADVLREIARLRAELE
ncbi:creatininase family protein [Microbacterium dextranolyticum]|uniref:Creatininase n=1 Tax=Microbacterium dextranolyticum TaxID=36806 RepID=A0A9W6HMV9_9MICO|nr:creatininase family protein [Microbacterium dextranolyticum]MBM7463471.1 creatinine amidohydrolase [Microbacterium dextranolyticum]GLJ95428.1 creatininase [Microbacterium dextranolyticum]